MRLLILSAILFCSFSVFSQVVKRDSVQFKGNHVYLEGRRLTMRCLENLVRFDPEAKILMAKAKSNYQASAFLGALGIAVPFFPISQLVRGDDPNWLVAVAGVAALGLSFHLRKRMKQHIAASIIIYHRNLGTTSGGLGLRLQF